VGASTLQEETNVIKALRACRRAPGMAQEEFVDRWERHAELVLAVPGVRGYAQSPRVGGPEHSTAPFDGYSAVWFDDEEALARARRTPEAAAVRAGQAEFMDAEGTCNAVTHEVVQRDLPVGPDAVKLVFFFHRRIGLSREIFRRHWLETHAPLVMEYIESLRRFVQNYTVDSGYEHGDPDFDGLVEAYLDDLAALEETEESPEHDLVRSDEPNFIDVNRVTYMVCSERVFLTPPEHAPTVSSGS
jgi:uncharacterized protein (TIGR02118 family)